MNTKHLINRKNKNEKNLIAYLGSQATTAAMQSMSTGGGVGSLAAAYQSNPYFNTALLWPGMKVKQRRGVLRRAVFSDSQRKGLETAFIKQKYISKPDRKKLAVKLSLKDSQVGFYNFNIYKI